MNDFIVALGLVLVVEGVVYALAPGHLKEFMRKAQEIPDQSLRLGGVAAMGLGVLIVWLVRSLSG
ncbi:hypothetical protein PsW64_01867 [Pseudovibrio sp. W64]|jgi:uncharacterized protein YjeT (DUF2065 family)|uniref:DUF2065 domain-containing protein n=1 Tax=Pseudovibrio ascidiaceicola TaxID=285279 RepID=A0A1I3XMJ3_9HYPH|nr:MULTISPECIES: DUF2065 domain-containing protein [Pseudovibrio]KZK76966.1 hypothetical protein PsAD46_04789 [Pseudovibrio sp. Ad46]KZK83701.1 hypothetical protein PsW64_01867 [Pseudovibrio sp. W64]KZK89464.1 hypothetical protein PsAD5_04745 [Pseudovibrio sp. Ad5]KZK99018.1 hypothetical protein PsAD26_04823 [Pseudovibrio sp. Ad26]KZL14661.1 hypothetical protein PsAD37_04772 [Pseudovibrio sp. Ad37]